MLFFQFEVVNTLDHSPQPQQCQYSLQRATTFFYKL